MIDWEKALTLTSSRETARGSHYPKPPTRRKQDLNLQKQNRSPSFVEWYSPVVITIHHGATKFKHEIIKWKYFAKKVNCNMQISSMYFLILQGEHY